MYFVYILYSASRQKYYVGYTASLADRLAKHNAKHKGFTNVVNDWKIIYSEKFPSKIVAMAREKQIKGWKSRQLIDDLIKKRSNEHQR